MTSLPLSDHAGANLVAFTQTARWGRGQRAPLTSLRKYQIVSLLDMLNFALPDFVAVMRQLADVLAACHGQPGKLSVAEKPGLMVQLRKVETHAAFLGLDAVLAAAKDFIGRLNRNDLPLPDHSEVETRVDCLRKNVEYQLRGKLFMFLPLDKAAYWEADRPFGRNVADRFPKAAEDIVEAGNCFATARFTAAVFHLMRVMEIGVRRLAARLKLSKGLEQRPWGAILPAVDAEIGRMPNGPKKERYAELAVHLRNVKDAWRNPTMHPKRTYTESEARAVHGHVREFMVSFAKRMP